MKHLLFSIMLVIAGYAANAQPPVNITRINNHTNCQVRVHVYCFVVPCSSAPSFNVITTTLYIPAGQSINAPDCGINCMVYPPGTPPPVPYCANAYNVEFDMCPDPTTRMTNVISGTLPNPATCGLPVTAYVTDYSCCDNKMTVFHLNNNHDEIDIFQP